MHLHNGVNNYLIPHFGCTLRIFLLLKKFKLRSHKLEKKTSEIIYTQYHEYSLFLTNKPIIRFCFGRQIKSKIQNSDKVRLHHLVTW